MAAGRVLTLRRCCCCCCCRRAPDRPYQCGDICYNKTTRTRFWGFVSCIVKLADLASGKDARLVQLTDMVREGCCDVMLSPTVGSARCRPHTLLAP